MGYRSLSFVETTAQYNALIYLITSIERIKICKYGELRFRRFGPHEFTWRTS